MIELLPFGRDLSIALGRQRLDISYSGVYRSYQEAKQSIPGKASAEYDIINKNKTKNANERVALDSWFHDSDYPLLFWLSRLLQDGSSLVELGGSLGHFFYSIQKFFKVPDTISWTIYELPNAVEFGKVLAEERGESRLAFSESKDIAGCGPVDIFLTSGTLQYMDVKVWDILREIKDRPQHVLLHNLPVHAHRSFYTVQVMPMCQVPYGVYSGQELLQSMKDLGYELVAQWKNQRTVEIPFHRQIEIEGYLGFYFKRV